MTQTGALFAFTLFGLAGALPAMAGDPAMPPAAPSGTTANTAAGYEAARLMAAEVALRAKKVGPGSLFSPPPQRTIVAPAASPAAVPVAADAKPSADAAPGAAGEMPAGAVGQRFMPLKRNMTVRDFPLQQRGDVQVRAEALRASVAAGKSEKALGQTALDAANAASPADAAAAEMQQYSQGSGGGGSLLPAGLPTGLSQAIGKTSPQASAASSADADPEVRAKAQMLEAVRRYRYTHGMK